MTRPAHLAAVEAALDGMVPAGFDGNPPARDRTREPREMPEDCPVSAVGTIDGIFYFLDALGQLRGLTADKVANKHIVSLFAPDSQYLLEAWPRREQVQVKVDGKPIKDNEGNPVLEWLTKGFRNDDVAQLLMDACAEKGVWEPRERVRGRGAWKHDDGSLILHCGNWVQIGGKWTRPGLHEAMVYPTQAPMARPRGSSNDTAESLAPGLVQWLASRGCELGPDASPARAVLELLKTWNWQRPLIDPILLLGWLGCAPVGGALDYRPIAWITGGAGSGKTTLQELVDWLLESGLLQSSDASEAGVRQTLGQQSLPVGLDEAEAEADSRKMKALVKLARLAATSQGNLLRGGQDHRSTEFRATSCFLFSSVLVPPIEPAERSRMAMLCLDRLPIGPGVRRPRFDRREIAALGAWMRMRFAAHWQRWPLVLDAFHDAISDLGDQSGRAADQFGTLRAAAELLLHDAMPDADDLADWGEMLGIRQLAETANLRDESEDCLHILMTSSPNLAGYGPPRLVSEWVWDIAKPPPPGGFAGATGEEIQKLENAKNALARIGMAVVDKRDDAGRALGTYLAVANDHRTLGALFEGTKYALGVWQQALERVPGALKQQVRRIAKRQVRCTLVPIAAAVSGEAEEVEVRERETV